MGYRIHPSNYRGFVYTHVEYPSVMVLSDYEVGEGFTLDLIEEFPCPRCDKTLRVPKDHSGKIMCPNCEWKFQFPLPPEVDWENQPLILEELTTAFEETVTDPLFYLGLVAKFTFAIFFCFILYLVSWSMVPS